MECFVRLRINRSVQPRAVFVTLNHRLVERDVIRVLVGCRLSIALVNPIVDCLATVFGTEPL